MFCRKIHITLKFKTFYKHKFNRVTRFNTIQQINESRECYVIDMLNNNSSCCNLLIELLYTQ